MKQKKTVLGHAAPPVTLTKLGAFLLAVAIALPFGAALALAEWLLF